LYQPFQAVRAVTNEVPLTIEGQGLQILLERREPSPPGLRLSMRCGLPPEEVVFAGEGYDATVRKGFSSAWGPKWVPPVYHCRASEDEVLIEVKVPKEATGTLRLFVIDPDNFMGGRKQEAIVAGESLGTIENFEEGRWLEYKVSQPSDADRNIPVQVINRREGANAVISLLEWLDGSPSF